MQINLALTAIANVLALFNAANGLSMTEAQISVGAPSVFDDGLNPRNTQVTLTALGGGGAQAETTVDVRYTRLGLTSGVAVANTELEVADDETEETLLAKAAVQLGLLASEVEWDGTVVLPADGENGTATLKAIDGSLLYVGTLVLDLVNPAAEVPLGELAQNGDLDGFDPVV